jgi:hypothetical protein
MQRYDGKGIPTKHLEKCRTHWRITPPEEWSHHFIHTLEGIPGNWYVDQEMRRDVVEWTTLQYNFIVTFTFKHENPNIDSSLNQIRGVIFIDEPEVELMTEYQQ